MQSINHFRRVGKFELADGGTLLLDEISEIPVHLQAKLLRVLEEEEYQRVGGTESHRVDVRIVATTNRCLQEEIGLGNFREAESVAFGADGQSIFVTIERRHAPLLRIDINGAIPE